MKYHKCLTHASKEINLTADGLIGSETSEMQSMYSPGEYDLVQKLLEKEGLFCNHAFPWHSSSASICDALLTPTKIYLKRQQKYI
jgi:phosphoribosylaminoimidazole (AIR) synthetase